VLSGTGTFCDVRVLTLYAMMLAVISMRKESSSPLFHSVKTCGGGREEREGTGKRRERERGGSRERGGRQRGSREREEREEREEEQKGGRSKGREGQRDRGEKGGRRGERGEGKGVKAKEAGEGERERGDGNEGDNNPVDLNTLTQNPYLCHVVVVQSQSILHQLVGLTDELQENT